MRITRKLLRRIIHEEAAKSTEEYDEDSALVGDQDELPDALQKGIIDKTVEDRKEKQEESRLRLSKRDVHLIIQEVQLLEQEMAYGEFAESPEVQKMLMAAGFNADGSFGQDGYPGPGDWQLYSPENLEDAEEWIQAALDMNEALREAEEALAAGQFATSSEAYYDIVEPVQRGYSRHGAADTEGREVAGAWLEDEKGYRWE